MASLEDKQVLVIGLHGAGRAVARLLLERGADVTGVDGHDAAESREAAGPLQKKGATLHFGATRCPEGPFDFVVVCPGVMGEAAFVSAAEAKGWPVISELEFAYEQMFCLNIAVTGSNGKSTTARLVAKILEDGGRKTRVVGGPEATLCDVVRESRDLDYLTVEALAPQLERTRFFRPSVAVLTNIVPDHLDRYRTLPDYVRAMAQVFARQQSFDWAIVQSEALAHLRTLGLPVPGKLVTFSARSQRADLFLDRSLIVSRIEGWEGPLFDMDRSKLRGPHNAENIMAALAVGRVLRMPLKEMAAALEAYEPAPHRFEFVAEIGGVRYINDSRATNLQALTCAIESVPSAPGGQPNVWLLAGGRDKGLPFHDAGPLLSQRVKGAFLLGESREKLRAAWSLFTPCSTVDTLLEAVLEASRNAVPGDVVLLSPACSSFDQFQNYQQRGDAFRQAVTGLAKPSDSRPAKADRDEAESATSLTTDTGA
jgi:UDP-N-acetylmuramoylalanine--D-glutamate ligase